VAALQQLLQQLSGQAQLKKSRLSVCKAGGALIMKCETIDAFGLAQHKLS
jgi:hypothetical protein